MRGHIDRDLCTGHGVCEGIRPDIFEIGDNGTVAKEKQLHPSDRVCQVQVAPNS